jgi:hypothetical protein
MLGDACLTDCRRRFRESPGEWPPLARPSAEPEVVGRSDA